MVTVFLLMVIHCVYIRLSTPFGCLCLVCTMVDLGWYRKHSISDNVIYLCINVFQSWNINLFCIARHNVCLVSVYGRFRAVHDHTEVICRLNVQSNIDLLRRKSQMCKLLSVELGCWYFILATVYTTNFG